MIKESPLVTLPSFVEDLIDNNIQITICKSNKYGIIFDLNLDAKSHMHLYKMGNEWCISLRYNEDFVVNSLDDLMYYADYAMHGKDFRNPAWTAMINKYRGRNGIQQQNKQYTLFD